MRLHVEHLDDVIGSRIQMFLHTLANPLHVTPRDERIDKTVA